MNASKVTIVMVKYYFFSYNTVEQSERKKMLPVCSTLLETRVLGYNIRE